MDNPLLTKDQFDELKEAFEKFDLDGNGSLCPSEMRLAMLAVGHDMTEAELFDLIDSVPVEDDGSISFFAFVHMMTPRLLAIDSDESLIRTFKLFDRNRDGHIDASDIRVIMQMLGVVVTDEEIKDICREIDGDGDGRINLREFIGFMKSPI